MKSKSTIRSEMKKVALTIAIVLGISLCASAQWGGGLFQRGAVMDEEYYGAGYRNDPMINLPSHGQTDDQSAPLGSGIAVLAGLGGAYLLAKRRKAE